MFRRCNRCNKLLFQKHEYSDRFYCFDCLQIQKVEDAEERKSKEAEELKRKQERTRRKNEMADQKLKEELKREAQTKQKKEAKHETVRKPDQKADEVETRKTKPRPYRPKLFDQDTIDSFSRLLYIEADVKHIKVIDWLDGKKQTKLNKEREIRRTHAGGFSAEKFQRFIDAKKKNTFDWIVEELEKPGILRPPYDKIKVESRDEGLRKAISEYLESIHNISN